MEGLGCAIFQPMSIRFRKDFLLPLLCAVVVGGLSVAPGLLALHALGNAYQGVPLLAQDNEFYYLARIREVLDGYPGISSPYFLEYKHAFPLIPPVGEFLYAIPSFLFRVSPTVIAMAGKGIFPAILFLLVYGLIWRLTDPASSWRRWNALAGGLVVSFGLEPSMLPFLLQTLTGTVHEAAFSPWTRLVNPVSGALFLFGFLHALWSVVIGKRRFAWLGACLLLALMAGYIFSLALGLSMVCVLVLCYVWKRDTVRVKRLASVLLVGGILLATYVGIALSQLPATGASGGLSSLERNGLLLMHLPLLNKIILGTFVIFLAVSWRAVKKDWWFFCFAILTSSLLAYTQQVVTGFTIWPYHFVQYTTPLAWIVLFVLGHELVRPRWPRLWKMVVVTLGVAGLSLGGSFVLSTSQAMGGFLRDQQLAPVFGWLNRNATPDCVVAVPEFTNRLAEGIPAFTSCNVYLSANVFSGAIPESRLLQGYLVTLRLRGIDREHVRTYLGMHEGEVRSLFFGNLLQIFETKHDEWLAQKMEWVAAAYETFLTRPFLPEIKRQKIDYIISDQVLQPELLQELGLEQDGLRLGHHVLYSFVF